MTREDFDFSEEARISNADLATEIARITPLTAARLGEILPQREDQERLSRLIAIVQGAQSTNEKVAALRTNIEDLGGVVVTILKEFL